MNKAIKISFRIIVGISVFFTLYTFLCLILVPKKEGDFNSSIFSQSFAIEQEDEHIDVIFSGHSGVYSAISPKEVFAQTGYSSFDCAVMSVTTYGVYMSVSRQVKRDKPKVVVLDADCVFPNFNSDILMTNKALALLSCPFTSHARWKELKARDFDFANALSYKSVTKGYREGASVSGFSVQSTFMSPTEKVAKITKRNTKYLNKLVKLCNKEDIKLMFINVPNATSWNYEKHNAVAKFANANNIDYYDYNVNATNYITWETDYKDNGNHCNSSGALKMTTILSNLLIDKYSSILTNETDNENYSSWRY